MSRRSPSAKCTIATTSWNKIIEQSALLKETWHLSAGQTADFFAITIIPWLIKPVYGLLSDFVLLFGWRRRSYFLLTTSALTVLI